MEGALSAASLHELGRFRSRLDRFLVVTTNATKNILRGGYIVGWSPFMGTLYKVSILVVCFRAVRGGGSRAS